MIVIWWQWVNYLLPSWLTLHQICETVKLRSLHFGRHLMFIMGGNCVFRIELTVLTWPVSSLRVKIIASCLGFWLVGRYDLSNRYKKKPSSGRSICIPLKTRYGTHICSLSIYSKYSSHPQEEFQRRLWKAWIDK